MSAFTTGIAILTLLAAMALTGYLAWSSRVAAIVLALLSIGWWAVDQSFEGPTLVAVTSHNGFTLADIAGAVGLIVAAVLFARRTLVLRRVQAGRSTSRPSPYR